MNDLIAYRLEQETRQTLKETYKELAILFDQIIFPQQYLTYPKFRFEASSGFSAELKTFLLSLVEVRYEEIRSHFLFLNNFSS